VKWTDKHLNLEEIATYLPSPNVNTKVCMAVDCKKKATETTLTGLRFCTTHFSAFYSPEPFPFDEQGE
jgi:hypothetical protein